MKAFVKVNNGTFPNVNFYLAWEAFNTMGYSVTLFEEKDLDTLDITPETPVFAGVTVFRKVIDKLGVNYPPFNCYPDETNWQAYKRFIHRSTLGKEKEKFHKDGQATFVKPVLPKQFTGTVWRSILNLIPLANVPDDAEVWTSSPIDFKSEYRIYVHEQKILGVKHYYGNWQIVPDKGFIEAVIKHYKNPPVAYGVDIAVGDFSDGVGPVVADYCVIEFNDGCNLGNYGLDSIHYGEMIVSRWYEIMEQGGKGSELRTNTMKSMVEGIRDNVAEMSVDSLIEKMGKIKKVVPYNWQPKA